MSEETKSIQWGRKHTRSQAHLPFHPPSQQLQVDLAHQVVQENLGVLAPRWGQSHRLVPVKMV